MLSLTLPPSYAAQNLQDLLNCAQEDYLRELTAQLHQMRAKD